MKNKEDVKSGKSADIPDQVRQPQPLDISNILQKVGADEKKQHRKIAQIKIIDNPLNHPVKILNDKDLTIQ